MDRYGSFSDDFYINLNVNTEMESSYSRETTLHYFEQIQKRFPELRNFYCRERGEQILEEDKSQGCYRWASIEPKRVCSGHVNPDSVNEAIELHSLILEVAPYTLSLSPLDCESIHLMFGFDFSCRGNHNRLVADALGLPTAYERLLDTPGANPVAYEPAIQFAIDEDCRFQCRLSVETRTSAYDVRTGEFGEEQLSVYVSARRYGSLDPSEQYVDVLRRLTELAREVIDNHVVEGVLVPLQQKISML